MYTCLGAGAHFGAPFGAPYQKHRSAQKEEAASPSPPANHGWGAARLLTEVSKGHEERPGMQRTADKK